MPAEKPQITAEYLRSRLDYDPETGAFRWRAKPGGGRLINSWNARYVGTVAGSIDPEGYRCIDLDKRHFFAARLAWLIVTGAWPPVLIDHRDLDPGNNRWRNLRAATHGQNMANRRARCPSGLKGAYTYPELRGKYVSRIKAGGAIRHLGTFDTAEAAHAAFAEVARAEYGEFARLD